ncbi:unnamed protein product [Prunus armeniaca]|uniref:Serine-threonine/tyrosine-protein kinase catalytic domain-containing protein n=1 Tax=Prunus armeniaca TaxID=36596 RepID=A0A6J5WS58_PRUAR|nr:unnamed protein product [Prunus armeniaca]
MVILVLRQPSSTYFFTPVSSAFQELSVSPSCSLVDFLTFCFTPSTGFFLYHEWIDENSLTAAKSGPGMAIAVKRLNKEGLHGQKEWLAEVNSIGKLHNPNLVRLISYCLQDSCRFLAYEFMPRGSLDNHLFRRTLILLEQGIFSLNRSHGVFASDCPGCSYGSSKKKKETPVIAARLY